MDVDANAPLLMRRSLLRTVSYDLRSGMFLGSNWTLLCQPIFIVRYPFMSNPVLEILRALPPPHG